MAKVFVDRLRPTAKTKQWPFSDACHLLIAPDTDETVLHAFALSLGLKRSWFQVSNNGVPHYDLTASRRRTALRYGAKSIEMKRVGEIIQEWRAFHAADSESEGT